MASAANLTFANALETSGQDGIQVPDELLNYLQIEAENARDNTLDDERAAAIHAYQGDPYADDAGLVKEGRSIAMTRDVSEVIDFQLTGILGTVMAGGKAVQFETEPEDVEGPPGEDGKPTKRTVDYGAQMTAAVQYQFFRKQPGYRILHDALKSGLLEKTGIVRTFAQPRKPLQQRAIAPRAAIEGDEPTFQGMRVVGAEPLPPEQQPVGEPVGTQMANDGMGVIHVIHAPLPDAAVLHSITHEVPQAPIVRDEAIPNEWFLVSPDTVDLDESPYVGQRTPKSVSQLVAMGYDADRLKTIWDAAPTDTQAEYARDSDRGKTRQNVGDRRGPNRLLWFHEEYPLWDLNGDGIAERLYVARVGREVLYVGEVDEQPYSGWSPIPMQHRFTGQSMADKTMDIQRIRSVLLRQGLDSLYQSNAPRMLLPEEGTTADTIDDLLTVRPGALIRYKSAAAPSPLAVADTSATSFNAMELMSAERDGRTGVTRQSQGQNPDTTNKTATGISLLQQNADQIELYVTRNFTEFCVASVFAKRLRLMKAYGTPFRMKIDGQYEQIDPRQWPDEVDVQINVGIGTGTKDQRIGYLSQVLSSQVEARQSGAPYVTDENIYNASVQLIEDMGIGNPSRYLTDPSSVPPQPPQPDPNAVKAQVDGQTQQAKDAQAHEQAMARLQLQQQEQEANAALKAQANEQDLQAKREKAQLDAHLATQKAAFEADTAERQQAFEMNLAERRFAFDQEMARRKHEQADQEDSNISRYREGGSLSE